MCIISGFNPFCNGKSDGNHQYKNANGVVNEHYFLQCSNGNAYCQACWPLSLVFKPECNQCMYNQEGTLFIVIVIRENYSVKCC